MAKKLFIILVILSSMINISFASEANSDDTQIAQEQMVENEGSPSEEAVNEEPTYQEEPQVVEVETVESEQEAEEK